MNYCGKYPCGMTFEGCKDLSCPNRPTFPGPMQPWVVTSPPSMGCICPPTSEKTCENPLCPRRNPLKRLTAAGLTDGWRPGREITDAQLEAACGVDFVFDQHDPRVDPKAAWGMLGEQYKPEIRARVRAVLEAGWWG